MLRGSGQAGAVTWRCRREEEEEEEAAVAARGGLAVPSAQRAGAARSTCRVPNPLGAGRAAESTERKVGHGQGSGDGGEQHTVGFALWPVSPCSGQEERVLRLLAQGASSRFGSILGGSPAKCHKEAEAIPDDAPGGC